MQRRPRLRAGISQAARGKSDDPKAEPIPDEAREAADAFLAQTDALADAELSERWLGAMATLFEKKLGDARVLARVEQTFLDPRRDQLPALQLLSAAESPRLRELSLQRATLIMESFPDRAAELPELWDGIGVITPEAIASHRVAQKHGHGAIRAAAVEAGTSFLSERGARAARLAALDDPDPLVRRAGADPVLWFRAMNLDDLPLFRAYLAKESDPLVKQGLHNLVSDLERQAEADGK